MPRLDSTRQPCTKFSIPTRSHTPRQAASSISPSLSPLTRPPIGGWKKAFCTGSHTTTGIFSQKFVSESGKRGAKTAQKNFHFIKFRLFLSLSRLLPPPRSILNAYCDAHWSSIESGLHRIHISCTYSEWFDRKRGEKGGKRRQKNTCECTIHSLAELFFSIEKRDIASLSSICVCIWIYLFNYSCEMPVSFTEKTNTISTAPQPSPANVNDVECNGCISDAHFVMFHSWELMYMLGFLSLPWPSESIEKLWNSKKEEGCDMLHAFDKNGRLSGSPLQLSERVRIEE